MNKLLVLLLILAAAFSLVLVSCGGEAEEAQVEETAEAVAPGLTVINRNSGWEVGQKGGELVLGQLGSGPKSFNPVLAEETSSTDITDYMISDALVQRDQHTLEWAPALAESWEISDDEKVLTLTLRDDIFWSDGEPITAEDFEYTINNIIYDEGVQTSTRDSYTVGGELTEWVALDERTLQISAVEVYAGLLNIANSSAVPKHIVEPLIEENGIEAFNNLWGIDADPTTIPSSGPWVISEYIANQRISFEPNPYYYKTDAEGTQLPYLEQITFLFTPDTDTMLQQFLAGTVDVYAVRGEDYSVLVEEKENLGFEMYEVGASTSTNFITFNQNPDEDGPENDGDAGLTEPKLTWLSNQSFREAMAHLVDRQTYINNIAFGFGYPQYSFVPRFSPYYWEGADEAALKYDPIAAAELLDSIDYIDRDGDGVREDPEGNPIALNLATNSGNRVREDIITAFAQEAANVGIQITPRPVDFNELVNQLVATYDWDMILIGLTGSVDPISGANVYPSYGNLHMIEPNQESPRRDWEARVDEAWKEANETTDEAQRKSGWEKIQREWLENLPWVFTYNPLLMSAYDADLGNVFPQPINGYGAIGISEYLYRK
ncbi:ABC transporter substrate-binding protein [Salinispira pacifica]|uniref:Oligopeptide ABC transporter, periplasmic oligopeptide-binding protein OppA n=1 Tax=Salinispira pacifica TaxID=1307761 RepID=V5WML0_9SPIO|nr:ABC transporter substrate-binding protein [Salinispira pacifica]AHC16401.1 Oligopeptide ABC transporter, periplasmic oligopeptide-binding protein OppA [Salinispira pacifica]